MGEATAGPSDEQAQARRGLIVAGVIMALGLIALLVAVFASYLIGGLLGLLVAGSAYGYTRENAVSMQPAEKIMNWIGTIAGGIAFIAMVVVNWLIR